MVTIGPPVPHTSNTTGLLRPLSRDGEWTKLKPSLTTPGNPAKGVGKVRIQEEHWFTRIDLLKDDDTL